MPKTSLPQQRSRMRLMFVNLRFFDISFEMTLTQYHSHDRIHRRIFKLLMRNHSYCVVRYVWFVYSTQVWPLQSVAAGMEKGGE